MMYNYRVKFWSMRRIFLFVALATCIAAGSNNDGEIGRVFAVSPTEVEITGPQIAKVQTGKVVFIQARKGVIKATVVQSFHTKVKATVPTGHGITKADPVFLQMPGGTGTGIEAFRHDADQRLFFATPRANTVKYVVNGKPATFPWRAGHPLLVDHLDEGLEINYLSGHETRSQLAKADYDFAPVNEENRQRLGHIGMFQCEATGKRLICQHCDLVREKEICKKTGRRREFILQTTTQFYGHFFVKNSGEDQCGVASYKELQDIRKLDHPGNDQGLESIQWHIFSRDGRQLDAALILQSKECW